MLSNLSKKLDFRSNGRPVIPQANRAIFSQIIVMAQNRNLHIIEVLSRLLCPLPWELATPEGLLRKTNDAVWGSLAKNITPAEKKLLIQKVAGDQTNFAEVAMFVLSMALKDGSMSHKIDLVFYTYTRIPVLKTVTA